MLTPSGYGKAASYFTTGVAAFLSGIGASYGNLSTRDVCAYSQFNLGFNTKRKNPASIFVGRWGLSRAVFSLNSDWSLQGSIT